FTQEAFIWRQLRHENILPFYGVSTEVMDHSSLCLISPWMEDGNIRDFLARHPDHSRIRMIWDIASGIEYLHGFDPCVIHKDIRGVNILVGPKPHNRCYLANFGISIAAETQDIMETYYSVENARWTAPELWTFDDYYQRLCFADIYSFGCTVIEIYTEKLPYPDVPDVAVTYCFLQKNLPKQPEP
ncbi:kinase-like protein, partial [Hymenopellis radicata]